MNRKMSFLMITISMLIMTTLLSGQERIFAMTDYPVSDNNTDENGITMMNKAAWADSEHKNENYKANLDISINGLVDKKTFNEPIDVQIVHDISSSMDYICYAENHVSFSYYKDSIEAFSTEQIELMNTEVENHILNILKTKPATGKNDWISISGTTDKDGYLFTEKAYLVPKRSFTESNFMQVNHQLIKDFWVIDNPEASKDIPKDPSGYPYWNEKYHAGVNEAGSYYSLSIIEDPQYETSIHFGYFDRRTAIKSGCKTYTSTAYKLMSNFASELYNANISNHISITSFADDTKFISEFTNDSSKFNDDMINAFNSSMGQTNYEAGLIAGQNNLMDHNDNDGRKKYIIFISDGSPNRSLDDDGNVVNSSNMERLKQLSEEMKEKDIEIYTVGFCIDKQTNDTYLLPIASDNEHSHFRTPDQLDLMVEIYDLIKEQIIENTYIKSTVENTISQYYIVDKEKLPEDVTLLEVQEKDENGDFVNVQKIKYNVYTENLDKNGINIKTIPLILKKEYWKTNEYYPTNDEDKSGANAIYLNLDGTTQKINVKTPWLPVNKKEEAITYQINTEVVNGKIDNSIYNIKPGETIRITYEPKEGYTLKSITVDGEEIEVKMYRSDYVFKDITQNHKIRVVYEKEDDEIIIPDIDNSTPNNNSNISNDGNALNNDNVVIKNEKSKHSVVTGILDKSSLFKNALVISGTMLVAMIYTSRKHKKK